MTRICPVKKSNFIYITLLYSQFNISRLFSYYDWLILKRYIFIAYNLKLNLITRISSFYSKRGGYLGIIESLMISLGAKKGVGGASPKGRCIK